jgi:hypothetical protein
MRKIRLSVRRSSRTISSMSGYWTLTATASPEARVARWTWPIDADAIGTRSKVANTASGSPPSSSRMRAAMSG